MTTLTHNDIKEIISREKDPSYTFAYMYYDDDNMLEIFYYPRESIVTGFYKPDKHFPGYSLSLDLDRVNENEYNTRIYITQWLHTCNQTIKLNRLKGNDKSEENR